MDPSTQTPFPTTLLSPTGAVLKLQGTGVRTVSFLSIKVYAVGFYCDERTLKSSILKGYTEDRLLVNKNPVKGGPVRGEALIAEMIDLPHDAAVM